MQAGFLRFVVSMMALWAVLHAYVFVRLASLPWIGETIPPFGLTAIAVVLWSSYLGSRVLDARGYHRFARWSEPIAADWVGGFFLLFTCLLLADLVTLGGFIGGQAVIPIRGGAVTLALTLAVFARWQAVRPPSVRRADIELPGLPVEHDGLNLVLISDLHLGALLGRKWLNKVVRQVRSLNPDLVAVAGDLADHDTARVETLLPQLRQLQAPLGVWAVTGNHDAYAGLERIHSLMRDAGFRVLADEHSEAAPGLIMAGVDDHSVPRAVTVQGHGAIAEVLDGIGSGAIILLSHTPVDVEQAASKGAGLMLCGHTHGGQLWPFSLLVRLRYQFTGGLYRVGAMTLVVCRGTGTWGPRMRLWRRSEIWRLRLRSAVER